MTWDGVAEGETIITNLGYFSERQVATGNEVCRLCQQKIEVGNLLLTHELFRNCRIYRHIIGECPS